MAVSTGNVTDEMVQSCGGKQEGKPVHDDSRFVIDNATEVPPYRRRLFGNLGRLQFAI